MTYRDYLVKKGMILKKPTRSLSALIIEKRAQAAGFKVLAHRVLLGKKNDFFISNSV